MIIIKSINCFYYLKIYIYDYFTKSFLIKLKKLSLSKNISSCDFVSIINVVISPLITIIINKIQM